jgi:hypothetical protein
VVLFIKNVCCLERDGALDRSALIALDRKVCARSHVTAPISHGVGKLAMAARAMRRTQEYVACARSWFLRSSVGALERIGIRLIVVALNCSSCVIECTSRDYDFFFAQSHPFKPLFRP